MIGGFFAGVAGVLYIYYNGFISPEGVGIGASGLLWLMLIIGGTGTLWGGLIGSGVIFCSNTLSVVLHRSGGH